MPSRAAPIFGADVLPLAGSAGQANPPRLRWAVWPPRFQQENPYTLLFLQALAECFTLEVNDIELAPAWLERHAAATDVVHLQWVEWSWNRGQATEAEQRSRIAKLAQWLESAGRRGLARVWTVHNLEPHESTGAVDRLGMETVARHVDLIICHSEVSKREVEARFRPQARIVVMPIGSYADAFATPEHGRDEVLAGLGLDAALPTACCLGYLRTYKGLDLACDAIGQLAPRWQLVVAGPVHPTLDLEQLVARAAKTPGVAVIPRRISDAVFAEITAASDVTLLPYRKITGSSAMVAAWALGCGVIASDLPYFREMLAAAPDAGRLFESGNAASLAAALDDYLLIEPERRRAAAQAMHDRFRWQRVIPPLASAIGDVRAALANRSTREIATARSDQPSSRSNLRAARTNASWSRRIVQLCDVRRPARGLWAMVRKLAGLATSIRKEGLRDFVKRKIAAVHRTQFTAIEERLRESERKLQACELTLQALRAEVESVRHEEAHETQLPDPHAPQWAEWNARSQPTIETLSRQAAVAAHARAVDAHASSHPQISVLLPIADRATGLRRAIESLRGQSFSDWELIVVDHGRRDAASRLCAEYRHDPRIRHHRQANAYPAAAMQAASALARGAILAFIDADHAYFPGYLEAIALAHAARPDSPWCYFARAMAAEHGLGSVEFPACDARRLIDEPGRLALAAMSLTKAFFAAIGGFDRQLSRLADWDLVRRCAQQAEPQAVPVLAVEFDAGRREAISPRESLTENLYRIRRKDCGTPLAGRRMLVITGPHAEESRLARAVELEMLARWGAKIDTITTADWTTLSPARRRVLVEAEAPGHSAADAGIVYVEGTETWALLSRDWPTGARPVIVREWASDLAASERELLEGDPRIDRVFLPPEGIRSSDRKDRWQPLEMAIGAAEGGPHRETTPGLVLRMGSTLSADFFQDLGPAEPCHSSLPLVLAHRHPLTPLAAAAADNWAKIHPVNVRLQSLATTDELDAWLRAASVVWFPFQPKSATPDDLHCILRALARGCFVIARRTPLFSQWIGEAGRLFDHPSELREIFADLARWNREVWRTARLQALDRAYAHFTDAQQLLPLVEYVEVRTVEDRMRRAA